MPKKAKTWKPLTASEREIVEQHLWVVDRVLSRRRHLIPLSAGVEEASAYLKLHLCRLPSQFDFRRGTNFSTFVFKCLDRRFLSWLRCDATLNHDLLAGRSKSECDRSLAKGKRRFINCGQFKPSKAGIDSQKLLSCGQTPHEISIANQEVVQHLLKSLLPTQRTVVELYFGLRCPHEHSLAEVAELLAITKQRVHQILTLSKSRIRKRAVQLGLMPAEAVPNSTLGLDASTILA